MVAGTFTELGHGGGHVFTPNEGQATYAEAEEAFVAGIPVYLTGNINQDGGWYGCRLLVTDIAGDSAGDGTGLGCSAAIPTASTLIEMIPVKWFSE